MDEELKESLEDEQLKQMDDMENFTPPIEDVPIEEEKKEEEIPPSQEKKEEEIPPAEEKKEEPPKQEEKKEEEQKEEQLSEIDTIKKENEELRKTIENVMRDMGASRQPKPKTSEEVKAEEEAAKGKGPVILPFFKKEEDIDNAFKSVESANRFMTSVVATAVEVIGKQIPTIASRIADQQISLKMAAKEFFDNNKDLLPYKEYCGFITSKIASENPNLTIGELMEKVATGTREALRLKALTGDGSPLNVGGDNKGNAGGNPPQGQGQRKGPALPPTGGGGRKVGAPQKSALESELADMIAATEL